MLDDQRRNWKTTLAGILGGCAPIVQGYLTGTLTAEKCMFGVAIAILGVLSKDADKSGTAKAPIA